MEPIFAGAHYPCWDYHPLYIQKCPGIHLWILWISWLWFKSDGGSQGKVPGFKDDWGPSKPRVYGGYSFFSSLDLSRSLSFCASLSFSLLLSPSLSFSLLLSPSLCFSLLLFASLCFSLLLSPSLSFSLLLSLSLCLAFLTALFLFLIGPGLCHSCGYSMIFSRSLLISIYYSIRSFLLAIPIGKSKNEPF